MLQCEIMKIVEEREAWIHTRFIVDSLYITEQERRQITISVEPELMQLGLQYGLTYNIAPSKHRAIIVLECIPFDPVKAVVKKLINDVIRRFPCSTPGTAERRYQYHRHRPRNRDSGC